MKAKLIRSFAARLLLATVVSGSVYFLSSNDSSSGKSQKDLSTEEMKALLIEDGYKVLTEVELAEQLAAAQIEAEESQEQAATENATEKIVYRTMITVTSGMTSIDVGNALVSAKIIENRQQFVDLVEQKGLVQELRPGTFEVQSDMTIDQVIATIYKQ